MPNKLSVTSCRSWMESIEDKATKGTNIFLSLQFLARHNNKSIADNRNYFHAVVDKSAHRLLTNRQVHKAQLVLKTVGR